MTSHADLAHLNRSSSQRCGPLERHISVAPENRPTRVDGRLWTGGAADGRVGPSSRDGPPLGPERSHAVAVAGLAVMAGAGCGMVAELWSPRACWHPVAGRRPGQDPYLQVAADEERWTMRRWDATTRTGKPLCRPRRSWLSRAEPMSAAGRAIAPATSASATTCAIRAGPRWSTPPRHRPPAHQPPPSPQISCLTGSQGGP